MTSRYLPMLARPAPGPFNGDDWLFEIKWDGVRAIAAIGTTLSLRSRNDKELSSQFPELAELQTLAPGTVLDGEIVVMSGGRPDMQALLSRLQAGMPVSGAAPVTYIVFDILEKRGKDLTALPLSKRREILKTAVRESPHVVISKPVTGRGVEYYQVAVARGLEGIMAKRGDSRYESGARSDAWLKIKEKKSCDCVIAGYTPGQGGRSAVFGALLLGMYDNGRLIPVGKAGTGFSDQRLSELMSAFAPLVTEVPQMEEPREKVVWLRPVLVCEVAYMSVTRDRKLRIPRFLRLRDDKPAISCTLDQLASGEPATPAGGTFPKGAQPDLRNYHEKRNFSVTREPEGSMDLRRNTFVIQEHHSRNLHYDFRLERGGVLKSWAVPKGVPETVGKKHLAVEVEDHPLEYGSFEGEIPKGEYGAGTVSVWDSGTYDTKHWDAEKIEVMLHGRRLNGPYVLVKFQRAAKNTWLLFRTA